MMPIFENSFYLTNYENNHKNAPVELPKDAKKDPDFDDRVMKTRKKIDKYEISTEDESFLNSEEAVF